MAVRERDPLTGHETTGHEWAGITELNTRVPRLVWVVIAASHIWALVYWVLMPAWPVVTDYTRGLLGYDPRERVREDVAELHEARADWTARLEALPVEEVHADPALMARVRATAPALYGDNCAACHGPEATGAPGFPNLLDDDWLWGGEPEQVLETLRVGINSTHPETRFAQMPAFGVDGVLSLPEKRTVADYVLSLSGAAPTEGAGAAAPPERLAAGAELFAANCAGCHGEGGAGDPALGAPNLTDDAWLYGGDLASLYETIHAGRQGWMPHWEGRLDPAERKALAAWLLDRGAEGSP